MNLKYNRGFSLLEVLVAMAILSTAIIFIFRSYATALAAVKLSRDLTRAAYLAEARLWEIETSAAESAATGFNSSYETADTAVPGLKELRLNLSWQQEQPDKEYSIRFLSYLAQKNEK